MSSSYVDTYATIQIIGCVFNNPHLLDMEEKYGLIDEDFYQELHRVTFGAMYKIHEQGSKEINLEILLNYLSNHPKAEATFKAYNGRDWILKASQAANEQTFDYYYNRVKKFTLLRAFDNIGVDVTSIYNPDSIDVAVRQKQEEFLDNSNVVDIANIISKKVDNICLKYAENFSEEAVQAGDGIFDIVDKFKETPEVGIPMYGSLMNTITRGARLKKFYLRSAPSGVGKTRTMVADACTFSCGKIYDYDYGWINFGSKEPTLYITTEQELEEVQTMMLAFISGVDEENILNGKYAEGEEERVREAAKIIAQAPLYVKELPDFSLKDIENEIKKNINDHDIKYVCHDYIHTSLKILEEITKRSGGVKLREDNILFMLSTRLKDLCNKYGIFILSATQLNGDYKDSKTPDQNLLRGAKAIADKIDWGSILLPVTENDIKSLETILGSNVFDTPSIKMSIYKNRRGRYKSVLLWCKANLGCCRIEPMFCTTYTYEMVSINDIKIMVQEDEEN